MKTILGFSSSLTNHSQSLKDSLSLIVETVVQSGLLTLVSMWAAIRQFMLRKQTIHLVGHTQGQYVSKDVIKKYTLTSTNSLSVGNYIFHMKCLPPRQGKYAIIQKHTAPNAVYNDLSFLEVVIIGYF